MLLGEFASIFTIHHPHFIKRIGPQDVSPTRPPLRTIQTTGHHTLVVAFLNTVMQWKSCDYFFLGLKKSFAYDPIFSTVSDVPSRPCSPDVQHHPGHRTRSGHVHAFLNITERDRWAIAGRRCVSAPQNVAQRHYHPRHTTHPKLVRMPFRLPCVSSVAPIGCCRDYVYIPSVFEWGAAVSRYNSSSKRFPKCRV